MAEASKDEVEKKPRVEHVKGQPHPKLKQTQQQKKYRVVETSKYPVLGAALLKEKGKKVYVVEGIIDDTPFKMGVRRGIPLEFGLMLKQTPDIFALTRKANPKDTAKQKKEQSEEELRANEERNRRLYQVTVASMVVVIDEDTEEPLIDPKTRQFIPLFSYGGVGGEYPIEDISDPVLVDLYDAVMEVQAPAAAAAMLNQFQNGSRDTGSDEGSRA